MLILRFLVHEFYKMNSDFYEQCLLLRQTRQKRAGTVLGLMIKLIRKKTEKLECKGFNSLDITHV